MHVIYGFKLDSKIKHKYVILHARNVLQKVFINPKSIFAHPQLTTDADIIYWADWDAVCAKSDSIPSILVSVC